MPLQRISGAMVSDSTITSADVQDGSLTGADVQDGGLGRADVGESLIRLSSAQATQSGTFKDFTGIPSWARRVVLMLYGVSTSGTSDILVQLGVGSTPTASGYINGTSIFSYASGIAATTSTAGIPIFNNLASYVYTGRVAMELLEPGVNNWVVTATLASSSGFYAAVTSSGVAPLSGALGMVRLTTASSTPTFDAGYASISWE